MAFGLPRVPAYAASLQGAYVFDAGWIQIGKGLGLHRASDLSPTVSNHLFLPSCSDLTIQTWFEKGITTFKDLYNQRIPSYELSKKFDLPKYTYLFFQIRHFLWNQDSQVVPWKLW